MIGVLVDDVYYFAPQVNVVVLKAVRQTVKRWYRDVFILKYAFIGEREKEYTAPWQVPQWIFQEDLKPLDTDVAHWILRRSNLAGVQVELSERSKTTRHWCRALDTLKVKFGRHLSGSLEDLNPLYNDVSIDLTNLTDMYSACYCDAQSVFNYMHTSLCVQ